ncbi:poly-gamma-glutamate synthesis protein (capsule biosynthesis protein) [Cohnella sp. OV330]|uniref:CapA family protein n=1 Tax=Cohnella sp. OV330 TaxID=1855288 RepID=UPI0008E428D5|nr:CapA family protein [Cohnella sp. OV330]SFB33700.1 poly-gamma-glutamate synthesis protein (capsule biosynthesis protein) [Cohnella sp. OV330]
MPYSRVQSKQKAKRRRRWPIVSIAVLAVALIAAVGIYAAFVAGNGDGGASQSPPPVATASSSASATSDSRPEGATASPAESSQAAETPDAAPSSDPDDDDGGAGDPLDEVLPADPSPSAQEPTATPDAGTADDPSDSPPSGASVSLAFVGDILPASTVGKLIEQYGVDYPFKLAKPLLESADIAAGNLEAPITTRGTPAENKQFVFKGKPEYLAGLKNAGLDVVSLANNHTLDQGWEGLSDTMDALDDIKLKHMGSGADDKEAFEPVYIEHNGITVAYIGVSNVVPDGSWKAGPDHPGVAETYDTTRAVAAVKKARELAEIVVVMVHWGNERADTPKDAQFNVGHTLIDAGADLIVGSHPHVLQGFEAYKGKWIAYSLGNFVFTTKQEYSKTQDTGVLTATCTADGKCRLKFDPMYAKASQPGPMEPEQAQALLARLNKVSYGATVDSKGRVSAK